jgi:hypothetical protein
MNAIPFSTSVHKLGVNPCVDVPEPIVGALLRAAGKERGPVPVEARLRDVRFKSTVVKYRGSWRLYLNQHVRRETGVDVGDAVRIALSYDSEPRSLPTPPILTAALQRNRRAHASWNTLPPSHRNEILAYLNSLKREATLERNVQRVIERLLEQGMADN